MRNKTPWMIRGFWGIVIGLCVFNSPILAAGKDTYVITADRFELDGTTRMVTAYDHVLVTQKSISITAAIAKYNSDKSRIWMTGNVEYTQGNVKVRCDALLVESVSQIVEATGNVRFFYLDISGTSQSAKFYNLSREIVLLGNPKIKKGSDELSGTVITVNLDTRRIKTQGSSRAIFSPERLTR